MNSKLPGKQKHLFVVKEGLSPYEGRMLSAENLSEEQQLTARRYIGLAGAGGVMVGALVNAHRWDVRPLLLQQGQLFLLRFSDPALALKKSPYTFLRATTERVQQSKGSFALQACGEAEGQVWALRRYFQQTLADEMAERLPLHPLQLAQKIIRVLASLHQAGIIHGHLCPQNMAVENQEVYLFDQAFLVASLPVLHEVGSLAPELHQSLVPSFACDIYGLGLILKQATPNELVPAQAQLLERMTSAEPNLRPSLDAVREVFMPRESAATAATVATFGAQPGLASGKVLSNVQSGTRAETSEQVLVHAPKIITPRPPVASPAPVPARSEQLQSPIPVAPAAAEAGPAAATSSAQPPGSGLFLPAVLALVLAGAGYYTVQRYFLAESLVLEDGSSFDAAWNSSQPSRMQQVALAATNGNSTAQLAIISDVMRGQNKPLVRSNLIRTAFNPSWERDLSKKDRELVLKLALARLVPLQGQTLPALSSAHPAVAFAVAGDLPDLGNAEGSGELKLVPISNLAFLPAPYGQMFAQLEQTGVKHLGELPARALSHILSGDASEQAVSAFFGDDRSPQLASLRLALLYPLAKRVPQIEGSLIEVLAKPSHPLYELLAWFDAEELPQWNKIPRFEQFALLLGELPKVELSFEQYVDLLRFPDVSVREQARGRLLQRFLKERDTALITFLASSENKLSRFQLVSLISGIKIDGESGYALVDSVLSTEPDSRSMLGILLARASYQQLDPINVELARYLLAREVVLSFEDLKALVAHPEQLARALAYARLDPKDPEERKLLENAVVVEPSARLKSQVSEKLKGVQVKGPEPKVVPEKTAAPDAADTDLTPF